MTYTTCAVWSIVFSSFRCELVIKYHSGFAKALSYADSNDFFDVEGYTTA